jgi:hypothetical protein
MAYSLVNLLPLSFRPVFSHIFYITLLIAIALTFWIIFNLFEQLIFFWPVWVYYLPEDALLGLVVTTITAILLGILISMNICHKKFKAKDNQVFIILWHRTKYIVQYMCQLLFTDLYIWRIRNSDI